MPDVPIPPYQTQGKPEAVNPPSGIPRQAENTQSSDTPNSSAGISSSFSPTTGFIQSSSGLGEALDEDQSVLDVLLSQKLLTQVQVDAVKVKSAQSGMGPVSTLQSMNLVPAEKIIEAQAKLIGVPYISLATTAFSPMAISFLPRAVVERFNLIPFSYDEKEKILSIAMADPVDLEALAFVRQKTGLTIKSFAASPPEVKNAIEQQYRQELVGEVGKAIKETEEFNAPKRTVDSKQIAQIIQEAPIAKIVSTILEFAVNSRASDVHIEPQEDRVRVRYRIDGILYDKLSLPKNVQSSLVSRIKILAELKIDEHRIPQDGRFNFKTEDQEVDLRVSTVPTVKGEKIVMRLLRKSGGIPTLPELGMAGISLKHLEQAMLRPHGIILVCGPTGSGKTTTLYAVLSRLNTTRVNIASLEDPVEYEIPGVNQVQINPPVGLTFASGLRAFLRQDPNIILVGEIRDKETTDLAIQAALTGHLVFSTIHTSSAAGALPRLIDLGAEAFLIASTVNAIVGQRIVRKICKHCKESYQPPTELVTEMRKILGKLFPEEKEVTLFRGKGCAECNHLGYQGRIGIYEVLSATDKIARLIIQREDATAIEKQSIEDGMITIQQDGYLKVLSGDTTIEEVLRVAQE